MHFAVTLPWWGYAALFAAAAGYAWFTYVAAPVAPRLRWGLTALRALTLALLVAAVLRPVRIIPPAGDRERVVPILVDVSRSMRIADAAGPARLQRARAAAERLAGLLQTRVQTELWAFGDGIVRADPGDLQASAPRSDLSGALAAIADRYRGRALGGIVVISDGGDTAPREADALAGITAPVFTVGVGEPAVTRDREVVSITAGEPKLADSTVDVHVSAVSTGFGTQPLELTLTANGRPVDVRKVAVADGAPVHEVFTVSPDATTPTVYRVEVPVAPGEIAAENNTRSVLVEPPGRRRRLLLVEGAPGYEHTFLKRALAHDTSLDIDAVIRKGQTDDGHPTFYVQAAASRAEALATGYPIDRAALFQYDAVLFGNVEAAFFTREQLEATAAFVSERGGGLLVLGGRSFEQQGLSGTALEEVLPVDVSDRRGIDRVSADTPATAVQLTTDGADHPATRLGPTADDAKRRWQALPPLAAIATVGGPRPGAQVLATASGTGGIRPLLAVQRYGQGRAMVFAGEASWRWRMMLPSGDTTYDTIWRQMIRWLSRGAPEAVAIAVPDTIMPGVPEPVSVTVRDREFEPVRDAEVRLTLVAPGGQEQQVAAPLADAAEGRYIASLTMPEAGVYRVRVDTRRGSESLGTAERAMLAGGTDPEMADPRLNEAVLKRLAFSTGGLYVRADAVDGIPSRLRTTGGPTGPPEVRDLWHGAWSLLAVIGLLGIEWALRRQAGMR